MDPQRNPDLLLRAGGTGSDRGREQAEEKVGRAAMASGEGRIGRSDWVEGIHGWG